MKLFVNDTIKHFIRLNKNHEYFMVKFCREAKLRKGEQMNIFLGTNSSLSVVKFGTDCDQFVERHYLE